MKTKFILKPLLILLAFSGVSSNALAQLHSLKLDVKSINNEHITALVSFPVPVTGDLYLVMQYGGKFNYIGPGATVSTDKTPFLKNSSFAADITVLDAPSAGIAPGVYPLYQVVTPVGADPLVSANWLGGLSHIDFIINLANTVPTPTAKPVPTTTPVPMISIPTATPVPTPAPAPTATVGLTKYKSLGCSSGGCHKTDPATNTNKLLNGKTLTALKAAIVNNPNDMGYLANPKDTQFASDNDLQAIAAYLSTF
ncbi:MAG: hypothetical protein HOP02_00780 [Methylococcaceae bacterium]|nr:hypothetical protein [Methylococcaceae bacterium]